MTDPTTRLTLRIEDEQADPEEYAAMTARLRQELLDLDVGKADPAQGGQAPPGTRAVELAALGALIVTVAKSELLGAVVKAITAWLAGRQQRSVKLEVDGDVLELTGVPTREQRRLTEVWLHRHATAQLPALAAAASRPAEGSRSALIVASYDYEDPGLRRLRAPAQDAEALGNVLRDAAIGGFDVRTVLNEPAHVVNLAVEEFFADRAPDDLLVVHISGHGVKDEGGELFFATADTRLRRLAATAVAADFVNRRMNRTRSRRVVLLLDCCYAGAFERGMTARASGGVDIEEQLGGRGRAVITASSAMEYAFEGDQLTDAQELQPSVFSSALVEGLATGEADRDQDGLIALDELYDYVYDKVRATTPNQTPSKWTFGVQGDLYIARRSRPVTQPAPLPAELQEALDHPLVGIRVGAVRELERVLHSRHAGRSLAARQALERMAEDDSRAVSAAATEVLEAGGAPPAAAPPMTVTAPSVAVPLVTVPSVTATPTRPPVAVAAPPVVRAAPVPGPAVRDALLRIAGGLALLGAVLMIIGIFSHYAYSDSLFQRDNGLTSYWPAYALIVAVLAIGAGVRTLVPGDGQLIGPGALIGIVAAAGWGLLFLLNDMNRVYGIATGYWLLLVAHLVLLLAAGLTVPALVLAAGVRFAPRPSGWLAWLVALLGVASAVSLLVFDQKLSSTGFTWSGGASLAPWVWATLMALVLPAAAAVATPRHFAVALLAGWVGGGLALFLYGYYFQTSLGCHGCVDNRPPLLAFGSALLGLLVAAVLSMRVSSPRAHDRGGSGAS
jgi:hypothetical protein